MRKSLTVKLEFSGSSPETTSAANEKSKEDCEMPAEQSRGCIPVIDVDDGQDRFICKFCERMFATRSALGGHISKVHPGKSASYNHKKSVR